MIATLRHGSTEPDVCRENGWGVGTFLAGDEGYGVTIIQITALGEDSMLARAVAHGGRAVGGRESNWVLWCREWSEIAPEDVPQPIRLGTSVTVVKGMDGRPTAEVMNGPNIHGDYEVRFPDGRSGWGKPEWLVPTSGSTNG